MKQLAHIILAVFLTLPLLANADPIRFEYSGTVTHVSGDGMGFKVNDAISGWFEVDSANLYDHYGDSSYVYAYQTSSNHSDGISGHRYSYDHAAMYDHSRYGYDQLRLRDGSYYNSSYYYSYSRTSYAAYHEIVLSEYAEWFDVNDLLNGGTTTFSGSALADNAHGVLRNYSYYRSYYCYWSCYSGYSYYNTANFSIDTLRVSSHSVPEPGTLALLGLGLVGMAARRKRQSD